MNNEILFRAVKKDTAEWVFGFFVGNYNPSKTENEIEDYFIYPGLRNLSEMIPVESQSVCQYSGLKDNKGNKIFELDVIEYQMHELPFDLKGIENLLETFREVVLLVDGCFTIDGETPLYVVNEMCVVIGNIVDNKILNDEIKSRLQ